MKQDTALAAKQRRGYRRYLVLALLLIVGLFAVSIFWHEVQDGLDRHSLEQYLSELDQRDPDWRTRLYGKPLTEAQLADDLQWETLRKIHQANINGWFPYRQGLYGGMYQDPADPAAVLSTEQQEFMEAAHLFWQPVLTKVNELGGLPAHHRYVDMNERYDKRIQQAGGMYHSDRYVFNEGIEVEVLYHLSKNDPAAAVHWLCMGKEPTINQLYATPFLIERLLNLTQPTIPQLECLQQLLTKQMESIEHNFLYGLGDDLRMMDKLMEELSRADLPLRDLDNLGEQLGFIQRNSSWKSLSWFDKPREWYLKLQIRHLFRRPYWLSLKLHQLADRITALVQLEPAQQWSTWLAFTQENQLPFRSWWKDQSRNYPGTHSIPKALFLIKGRHLHDIMVYQFNGKAQLASALAAVLAERYRLEQGRFPKEWSELCPRYLEKPLLDPFTGLPLILKQNSSGMVIYSVGRERKDEGGEVLNNDHYWLYGNKGWDMKNSNVGTRVYLPTLRRQPAVELKDDCRSILQENTPELWKKLKEKPVE